MDREIRGAADGSPAPSAQTGHFLLADRGNDVRRQAVCPRGGVEHVGGHAQTDELAGVKVLLQDAVDAPSEVHAGATAGATLEGRQSGPASPHSLPGSASAGWIHGGGAPGRVPSESEGRAQAGAAHQALPSGGVLGEKPLAGCPLRKESAPILWLQRTVGPHLHGGGTTDSCTAFTPYHGKKSRLSPGMHAESRQP